AHYRAPRRERPVGRRAAAPRSRVRGGPAGASGEHGEASPSQARAAHGDEARQFLGRRRPRDSRSGSWKVAPWSSETISDGQNAPALRWSSAICTPETSTTGAASTNRAFRTAAASDGTERSP